MIKKLANNSYFVSKGKEGFICFSFREAFLFSIGLDSNGTDGDFSIWLRRKSGCAGRPTL